MANAFGKEAGTTIEAMTPEQAKAQNNQVKPMTVGESIPNAPAEIANLVVPAGFVLSPAYGLQKRKPDGTIDSTVVSEYVIIPDSYLQDAMKRGNAAVKFFVYDSEYAEWRTIPKSILVQDFSNLQSWRELSDDEIIISAQNDKIISDFVINFCKRNKRQMNKTALVSQMGWNKHTKTFNFFPSRSIQFVDLPGSKREAVVTAVSKNPTEEHKPKCDMLVEELKIYPKFVLQYAAMFVSPLLAWAPMDENIGIDLYHTSSSGKSVMQKIALFLSWGYVETFKKWQDTSASFNEIIEFASGVPFVVDDSHQMDLKLHIDLPHSWISGNTREKTVEYVNNKIKSHLTMQNENNRSVFLFNGENSLVSKVTSNGKSSGIQGRVIQLTGAPWVEDSGHVDTEATRMGPKVDRILDEAMEYGGCYIKRWLEYVATLDIVEFKKAIIREQTRLSREYKIKGNYQARLVTKVALISWCINELQKVFGFDFSSSTAVDVMMDSITKVTDSAKLSRTKLEIIMDEAISRITSTNVAHGNKKVYLGPINKGEVVASHNVGVYAKEGEFLAVSKDFIRKLISVERSLISEKSIAEHLLADDLTIYTKTELDDKRSCTRIKLPKSLGGGLESFIKIKWDVAQPYIQRMESESEED